MSLAASLETVAVTKTDESSKRGGRAFSIQAFLGMNLQQDFPKMRGGGSKAVWNFSSVLVAPNAL